MGSSSDDDGYYAQPAQQGPPVEQIMPGAPPPPVPSFLPGTANQMATGVTQPQIGAINSYDAAIRQQIEDMYNPPQGAQGAGGGGGDPRQALAMAVASAAEEAGRAPMNRAGGRMPWDEEAGRFTRNPDWLATNRAGQRASPPGWGGSLAGKIA